MAEDKSVGPDTTPVAASTTTADIARTSSTGWFSWMRSWWTWCPTSLGALQNAEARILSFIKTKFEDTTVQISNNNKINTVCINTEMGKRHIPLVMMHGFGSGIALWVRNLDSLSKSRPLYCFDLLGFGRSSRPRFSNKAEIVEAQFVESVEEWRKAVGLNSFILLGHSLGGYLAAAYALRYPSRVKQLILADPWGFPQRPTTSDLSRRPRVPVWIRAIVFLMQPFNPLAILRAAGPWGPSLIQRIRPDMKDKFKDLDEGALYDYIYHCNAQEPSGESAFRALTVCVGWAKNPMLQRIQEIDSRIPITMIYGSRSWVDSESGWAVKDLRKDSVVDVHVVKGSGHHVYSEQASEFNTLVRRACDFADSLVRQEKEAGEALRLDGDDKASTRETLARSVSVLTMKDNPPRVGVVLD